ncbi:Cytochrome P450 3A13-like protein, partial [Leptotrombidium deliense]
ANSGDDVDVHRFASIIGLETIALTTFGWDLSLEPALRDEIIDTASDGMCPPIWKLIPYLISPQLFGFIEKYFGIFKPNFYHDICARIVNDRLKLNKSGAKKREDFLQLLLDAENIEVQSRETSDLYDIDSEFKIDNKLRKQKLSEIEVHSQLYVNILIGYSSLGNFFTTILYLLAKHRDEQEKLFSEIEEEMKNSNGKINFESISKLPYLDAFICETLRLYPSTTHSTRVSNSDYALKEVPGFSIPKNIWVLLHIYSVHR